MSPQSGADCKDAITSEAEIEAKFKAALLLLRFTGNGGSDEIPAGRREFTKNGTFGGALRWHAAATQFSRV